jgi:phospholipid transport system substrate-binding protein
LVLIVYFLVSLSPSVASESASAVVEKFHDSLLAIMKGAEQLGGKGRYEQLAPKFDQTFYQHKMVRVASGRFWKGASEAEQADLLAAFRRMSISTYASQFDSYSGQSFETVGERAGPKERALVETRILDRDGPKADLTYVLEKVENHWLIVDVLLDNSISQLAVRRSEYRHLLRKNGINGLISALDRLADKLVTP